MNGISESNDTVTLWKSSFVRIDDDHSVLMIYYYHTERNPDGRFDRDRRFYRCCGRYDSNENWKSLADSILRKGPAQEFRTSSLGLDDDYSVFYPRMMTNADMSRWLKNKMSMRTVTVSEFISLNNDPKTREPFILNLDDIVSANGSWVCKDKEKKTTPYARKRVIM